MAIQVREGYCLEAKLVAQESKVIILYDIKSVIGRVWGEEEVAALSRGMNEWIEVDCGVVAAAKGQDALAVILTNHKYFPNTNFISRDGIRLEALLVDTQA